VSAASQPLASRPVTLSEAEKLIEQLQQKLQVAELRVLVLEERLRLRRIEKRTGRSLSRPRDVAELCLVFEVQRRLM